MKGDVIISIYLRDRPHALCYGRQPVFGMQLPSVLILSAGGDADWDASIMGSVAAGNVSGSHRAVERLRTFPARDCAH